MDSQAKKRMRITIKEVAAIAGVTPAVVSRIINNDPEFTVLESTKARVYDAIAKTGYKPNPMARGLRRNRTGMVGLIIVDFTNPFYGKLIRSIQDSVEREGYACLVSENMEDNARTRKLVDLYLERQMEGLILCTATENDPVIDYLESMNEKYILATRRAVNSKAPYVGFNNEKGMRDAMEYLIALGHRRIGHITGFMDTVAAHERLNGYRAILQKYSIPLKKEYIIYGDWMVGNAQKCVHTLLQLPDPPTAIIACNDVVAISALNTVHEMGLRVPEDISLIGFNNIPESANTFPPLTTIDSPTEILGQYAAELLLKVMSSEGLEDTEQIIDTKLIVRGSTGPCRSDNQ